MKLSASNKLESDIKSQCQQLEARNIYIQVISIASKSQRDVRNQWLKTNKFTFKATRKPQSSLSSLSFHNSPLPFKTPLLPPLLTYAQTHPNMGMGNGIMSPMANKQKQLEQRRSSGFQIPLAAPERTTRRCHSGSLIASAPQGAYR